MCQILDFQRTCNPCCYYVFLAIPPFQILQDTADRNTPGAGVPGTSLRLEIIILTQETQKQILVMALPPDCMDEDTAGEHKVPEDTDQGTPDLGRLEMHQTSSPGSASS